MSEETKITRDFESYENGLYQLFMNKGLVYLRAYLLKMSMDKVRIAKNKEFQYVPFFIYPYWEIYDFDVKKLSLAIFDFITKKKDEAYGNIEQDFNEMKKSIEPSFEKIQFIVDKYFYDIAKYNQINETFSIQLKYVQGELRDITSALPKDIKTYYLKKRSALRKLQSEIDKLDSQISKSDSKMDKTKNLDSKEKLKDKIENDKKLMKERQKELSEIVDELDDIKNIEKYVDVLKAEVGKKKDKEKAERVFKVCEYCGTKNEENRIICKYCGRKLAKLTEIEEKFSKIIVEKYCKLCGTQITGKGCDYCGIKEEINLIMLNFAEIGEEEVLKEGVDIFGGIVSSSRRAWKIKRGVKRSLKKTPKNLIIYNLIIDEDDIYLKFPQIYDIISPLLYKIEFNGVKFRYIGELEKKYIFTDSEHSKKILLKYRRKRQTSNFSYQKSLINLQNKLFKNARKHTGKVFKAINKDLLKELT
jgi:hypothetical protein